MRKTFKLLTALVLVICLTTGCTTYKNFKETFIDRSADNDKTITIAVLEPQTGSQSEKGKLETEGIEIAHSVAHNVLGKNVELIYADTQSNIYSAETAVDNLIKRKPAVVLGSAGEAATLIAARKLSDAGIPGIAITSSNPLITKNNEFYFRVNFNDAGQGKTIADFVYNKLGQDRAGVIKMKDEDTTSELVNRFTKNLNKLSESEESVAFRIEVNPDKPDYSGYVQQIRESGVRSVFMPVSLATAEKIFEEAEKAGLRDVYFIGPNEWHDDSILEISRKYSSLKIAVASNFVSNAEEGDYTLSDQNNRAGQLYQAFLSEYEKRHRDGEPPEAAVLGFDAYMVAVQAIYNADSVDGFKVKEALKQTEDFAGASGEISFDEFGEPRKPVNIDMIVDGKFVSVYTVE